MFGQEGKTLVRIVIALCVVLPVGVMFWDIQWGVLALVAGLITAARAISILHTMQLEGTVTDQEELYRKSNQEQTIYVQLVDDAGSPLPAHVAQAKLAEAHRAAGPRDTVLGIHRKIS